MVFSSSVFLFLFLPVVLLVHFVLPRGWRNAWLLGMSLVFYGWEEPEVLPVMLLTIVVTWAGSLALARGGGRRRLWLGLILAFDLGILVYHKYWSFLGDNLQALAASFDITMPAFARVTLPVGISFFTFQAMSYAVDVFRGDTTVQKRPLPFAMYVALFPQLVAGPIVRYRDIARSVEDRSIRLAGFASGVHRFIIGFAKKMLIANSAAVTADAVFGLETANLTAATAWAGVLAYTVQIYFDFSGYSDMAIGLGRMLGFEFPENFRYPYAARSITDFWRRWHISLSSWFRDYLYIPLGGNRRGAAKTARNLVVVFLLCGLWHGAAWTFVLWGAWHGLFLVIERAGLGSFLNRSSPVWTRLYTLLVVVCGWVLFRAENLSQAGGVFRAMVGGGTGDPLRFPLGLYLAPDVLLVLVIAIPASLPVLPRLAARLGADSEAGLPGRWRAASVAASAALLWLSVMELAAGTHNPFIYFRF
ncbi:MAG TPA: MBOAT family protein [Planctomycetes bacterium]|nr:MBOAT family protein [Planctomycetota bacterium]